jgi:manganese transport system ATP-binding protein
MTIRVAAEQLCVDYNGSVALYDASLSLPAGCICGLVGMNGSGKSTLFKSLTGFVRPSRGRIQINGVSVAAAQREQAVAYMPQSEGIDCEFPVSVWDVVMMGRYGSMNLLRIPRQSDRLAVRNALERVELLDLKDRPLGSLSGGQRKRTFLARAIAQRASVLLLDEPFNGVDVRTEKLMAELFMQPMTCPMSVISAIWWF